MKNIWEFTKLLVTIGFCVWVLALIGGCAITLTEEEAAKCGDEACLIAALENKKEQIQYERENRRIKERDDIVTFINGCKAAGGNLLINSTWHGTSCRHQRARQGVCVPRNARLMDYQCISDWALRDILNGRR